MLQCSPVLCGEETSKLDDEEEKVFLVHLRSSQVKGEECNYNEKVDQIELLSAHIVTLNELVTHSPPTGGVFEVWSSRREGAHLEEEFVRIR